MKIVMTGGVFWIRGSFGWDCCREVWKSVQFGVHSMWCRVRWVQKGRRQASAGRWQWTDSSKRHLTADERRQTQTKIITAESAENKEKISIRITKTRNYERHEK